MNAALTQAQIVEAIREALGDATPALDVTEECQVAFLLRGARYRVRAGVRIDVETRDGRKLGGDFVGCDRLQEKLVVLIHSTAAQLAREGS